MTVKELLDKLKYGTTVLINDGDDPEPEYPNYVKEDRNLCKTEWGHREVDWWYPELVMDKITKNYDHRIVIEVKRLNI